MLNGPSQSEDDLAEKMRSNEILQRSIGTYGEVAALPNVPDDLMKLSLKRQADRQQFLGKLFLFMGGILKSSVVIFFNNIVCMQLFRSGNDDDSCY